MDGQTLLLNASWEPICSVSVRRAVTLVLSEKAEVITAATGRVVRSAAQEIPWPSVIRLVRYVNVPRFRKAYISRRTILARDGHVCCYCGGKATTMDHVLPKSRGGRHTWTNIVASCYPCNQAKDDRTPEEWGVPMRFKPFEPEGTRRIVLVMGHVDPEWEEWLVVA